MEESKAQNIASHEINIKLRELLMKEFEIIKQKHKPGNIQVKGLDELLRKLPKSGW